MVLPCTWRCYMDLVDMLLLKALQTLNIVSLNRGTPLHTAASIGLENVVHISSSSGGGTPFYLAAVRNLACVESTLHSKHAHSWLVAAIRGNHTRTFRHCSI